MQFDLQAGVVYNRELHSYRHRARVEKNGDDDDNNNNNNNNKVFRYDDIVQRYALHDNIVFPVV